MVRRRSRNRRPNRTVFADTTFWIAILVQRDQYHARAVLWKSWLDSKKIAIVTTQAVLWEWLNTCSTPSLRVQAAEGYRLCRKADDIEIIPFQIRQIEAALTLYATRTDKSWSLTDCLSFVVMQERKLLDALTADHHFEQAGFRALLLSDPGS